MRAYLCLLDALSRRPDAAGDGVRPLEVSLKLSALGRALDRDGDRIALENAHTICEHAQRAGIWVTVDAEDHTTTDSTLSIVRDLRTDFPWLGVVLQAYLRRTVKRLPRIRGRRRTNPFVQGRLRRTGFGGVPRTGRRHRRIPALSSGADVRLRLPDGSHP